MLRAEVLGLKVEGFGFARYLEPNTNDRLWAAFMLECWIVWEAVFDAVGTLLAAQSFFLLLGLVVLRWVVDFFAQP